MNGTLRRVDPSWFVDYSYAHHERPVLITLRWRVLGMRKSGMNSAFAPEPIDGLELSSVRDQDMWQAYRQGAYLVLDTEHNGTSFETEIAKPKVRAGVATRYHSASGRWQKYLKREGWGPA